MAMASLSVRKLLSLKEQKVMNIYYNYGTAMCRYRCAGS